MSLQVFKINYMYLLNQNVLVQEITEIEFSEVTQNFNLVICGA